MRASAAMLLLPGLCAAAGGAAGAAADKTHILFIGALTCTPHPSFACGGLLPRLAPLRGLGMRGAVADDHGFHDCSFTGSKVQTPTIDHLRASGIALEQHCMPPAPSVFFPR